MILTKKNIPKQNTSALTKEAVRVLTLCGFEAWRQNNGGVFDPTKKVFRANSSTPGISDVLGFHKKTGVIAAIEIKNGNDRLTINQAYFLDAINKAGGYAFVVKTSDDLEDIAKKLRELLKVN